jgi:isochorismate pyruvate lyase
MMHSVPPSTPTQRHPLSGSCRQRNRFREIHRPTIVGKSPVSRGDVFSFALPYGTMGRAPAAERGAFAHIVHRQRSTELRAGKRRVSTVKSPDECATIEEVRSAIDHIDRELIAALGRRFEYVKAIVRFKNSQEDVIAPERYRAVLKQRRAWATEAGLDPDVIEQMYRDLIAYFIDEEMQVLRQNGAEDL